MGYGVGRRHVLEVRLASGTMYHVSATANRGLDHTTRVGLETDGEHIWRRGQQDSLSARDLPSGERRRLLFVEMAQFATDIWGASLDGLWIESGPTGWWMCTSESHPSALNSFLRSIQRPMTTTSSTILQSGIIERDLTRFLLHSGWTAISVEAVKSDFPITGVAHRPWGWRPDTSATLHQEQPDARYRDQHVGWLQRNA